MLQGDWGESPLTFFDKETDMKKMRIFFSATVLLFVLFLFFHHKNKPSLILKIEGTPKDTFLKCVDESSDLTHADREIIREDVTRGASAGGYTHVKLSKYKQNGETYLEIDMYYPRKQIGEDSSGHTIVTGGSGSISKYKLENEKWRIVGGVHYD